MSNYERGYVQVFTKGEQAFGFAERQFPKARRIGAIRDIVNMVDGMMDSSDNSAENQLKNKVFLLDIDDTNIPCFASETPDEFFLWAEGHKEEVVEFKNKMEELQKRGFLVGNISGRPAEYVEAVARVLFGEREDGTLGCDLYISNGGTRIWSSKEGISKVAESIDLESKAMVESDVFRNFWGDRIKDFGGRVVYKECGIELYPPEDVVDLELWRVKIEQELIENGFGVLGINEDRQFSFNVITTSDSAEILAKGVDKEEALKQVIREMAIKVAIVAGDSGNDKRVIENLADIGCAPGPSKKIIKELVQSGITGRNFIGIHTPDLANINASIAFAGTIIRAYDHFSVRNEKRMINLEEEITA